MTKATRLLLLALIAGLSTGLLLRLSGQPALMMLAKSLKPVGALWLAALKMTLVPLVFSLVASAVNSLLASRVGGRTMATTVIVFALMLMTAIVFGMVGVTLLLRLWPTPPGALAGILHSGMQAPITSPDLASQLLSLVPDNPVAAAAAGQIAPLVVFALTFGWAISRLPTNRRASLGALLETVAEAMMIIVKAVLEAAPVGVFVLSLGAALEAGAGLAALLAQGVTVTVLLFSVAILLCHAIARYIGGVPWRSFARAAAAPQAVAAGTCSSMATLPALITAAEERLGFDAALAGATLPLAVSTFRFGTAMSVCIASLFSASAAGVHLGPSQYLIAALLVMVTNSGVVGLPGAAVLYAADAPIFQAIGAPLAFIPLWLAVFTIPDIFVTICNVTADLTAATVIRRLLAGQASRPFALATIS